MKASRENKKTPGYVKSNKGSSSQTVVEQPEAKGVELQQLENVKDPGDASTSLEYLVCTLSSKFELKPAQACLIMIVTLFRH